MNYELPPGTEAHIAGKIAASNPILDFMEEIDKLVRARRRRLIFFYLKLAFLGTAAIGLGWKYAELCHRQGLL